MKINFRNIKYSASEKDRIIRYFLEKNTYELNRISYAPFCIEFDNKAAVESEISIFQSLGILMKFSHDIKIYNNSILCIVESPPFIFANLNFCGDIELKIGADGLICEKINKELLISVIDSAICKLRLTIKNVIPDFKDQFLPLLGISIN